MIHIRHKLVDTESAVTPRDAQRHAKRTREHDDGLLTTRPNATPTQHSSLQHITAYNSASLTQTASPSGSLTHFIILISTPSRLCAPLQRNTNKTQCNQHHHLLPTDQGVGNAQRIN